MTETSLNTAFEIANTLNPWIAHGQKSLLAAARIQAQACRVALCYQVEALSFLKHRFEKDMKFLDELMAAESFNDAFGIYSGFCEAAVSDYSNEAGKMAGIGSRLAADTAKRVRKETETVAEGLRARSVA